MNFLLGVWVLSKFIRGGFFFEIFDTGAISPPVIAAVQISMRRYDSYGAAVPVTHNDWN